MKKKILIVNADDLGLCAGVNEGILETIASGIVRYASAFSMPGFEYDPEPYVKAGARIGIHFSLSFGNPVSPPSEIPSLLAEGRFKSSNLSSFDPSEIRKELYAQYERFCKVNGFPPSHMNFHKHVNESRPEIQDAAFENAGKFSLPIRTANPESRRQAQAKGVATNDHFLGGVSKEPFWTVERLKNELPSLGEGTTELMCHPGRKTGKIPGLWYLEQRDMEADTFVSEEAKSTIAALLAQGIHES